jgi:hypothetical protein
MVRTYRSIDDLARAREPAPEVRKMRRRDLDAERRAERDKNRRDKRARAKFVPPGAR